VVANVNNFGWELGLIFGASFEGTTKANVPNHLSHSSSPKRSAIKSSTVPILAVPFLMAAVTSIERWAISWRR
jgi:hypothetical protein